MDIIGIILPLPDNAAQFSADRKQQFHQFCRLSLSQLLLGMIFNILNILIQAIDLHVRTEFTQRSPVTITSSAVVRPLSLDHRRSDQSKLLQFRQGYSMVLIKLPVYLIMVEIIWIPILHNRPVVFFVIIHFICFT